MILSSLSTIESDLLNAVRADESLYRIAQTSSIATAGAELDARLKAQGYSDITFRSSAAETGWGALLAEVRDLVCTASEKYAELRKKIQATKAALGDTVVPLIAAAVAAQLGLTAAFVTPFVALALFGALKLGTEAWCRTSAGADDLAAVKTPPR